MAKQYKVVVNGGKFGDAQTVQVTEGAGRYGRPVKIKAQAGVKYQLQELERNQQTAPEHVKVKRVGKNLHVLFSGQSEADLILEDYYSVMPPSHQGLIGQAENGRIYQYIPEDPSIQGLVANLREGAAPINVALGTAQVNEMSGYSPASYSPTAYEPGLESIGGGASSPTPSGDWSPWGVLGGLALVGGAAALIHTTTKTVSLASSCRLQVQPTAIHQRLW
jgi:hypothetical protein